MHNAFEVFKCNITSLPKTKHDMIPRRAPVVEVLTALPFLITVGGGVETGDRQAWAHIALSPLPANHSR